MIDDRDEPTSPGTPNAKRTQSQELVAVRAENETLRARVIRAENQIAYLSKRHDALVMRVQQLENEVRR